MTTEELGYARAALGLTWPELGKALGLGRSTIYAYANGTLPVPHWMGHAVAGLEQSRKATK